MRIKTLAFAASLISTTALTTISTAQAQSPVTRQASFSIPAGDLVTALRAYSRQARVEVIFNAADLEGRKSGGLTGMVGTEAALRQLINGARVEMVKDPSGAYLIRPLGSVGFAPAAEAVQEARAPVYDEIIVTAQKKEERISDVPIAMSAFSAEALDDYKIEGGSELLRAIPNVNFSKSNFSMYNFSIRGVGTKATSASSDPAVAVSFNNTPLSRNRLFEAEFLDMQRVEVLRGPQGTLYGRNSTGGVVNLITALPTTNFEGNVKGEVGNYKSRRLSGMLNVPLTEELGVRVAGAMTKRDGYDYNTFTQERVNNRDLYSTRVTLAWEPSNEFKANFIWQHFGEDDKRSRTGKQLCTRDDTPETFGDFTFTDPFVSGKFSQGCKSASLYDDAAYGAPNGYSLSYIFAGQSINIGRDPLPPRRAVRALKSIDPFGDVRQSKNLREVSTSFDPIFRAKNDILQVNIEIVPNENLKFISQSSYAKDNYYSSQDYNRFVSAPIFNDSTSGLLPTIGTVPFDIDLYPGAVPGGVFCDPQLGCSDRMLSVDISQSRNRQWYQEFRLQSEYDGRINFNLGANYLDFKTQDKYYVFNNIWTLIAQYYYGERTPTGFLGPKECALGFEGEECIYVDPNPLNRVNDQGHNYFLSKNDVTIKSKAIFGELYYNPLENLKLTVGARYTEDKKVSGQTPSQLLLGGGGGDDGNGGQVRTPGLVTGGRVNSGYPSLPDINQRWREFTGRVVLDWKPDIHFTNDTLVYASVSRGYKGGGTNPPRVDLNPDIVQYLPLEGTFKPEAVYAYEVGMKNSFGGGVSLNATAFYYDYRQYQVSQIVDRIAFNENFDAASWGVELEAAFRPTSRLRFDASLGYLRTKIGSGERSIDVMNRTQGNDEWVVLRPWLQAPSNCIAPRALVEKILAGPASGHALALGAMCPGGNRVGDFRPDTAGGVGYDSLYGFTYDPGAPYDPAKVGLVVPFDGTDGWVNATSGAPNGGRGFYADISGNEMPNAPRLTLNLGGSYRIPVDNGRWDVVLHGDYYRQSSSFARVYNTDFDKIRGWDNVNLSVSLKNNKNDLIFQIYVKNVFNNESITDAFTNADDTGLSANVFIVDPRIIGFSVFKVF